MQTGFGRIGSHFWAFQYHGVVPDIVTIGKVCLASHCSQQSIGNGFPLAVVVTTEAIAKKFSNGMEYGYDPCVQG